MDVVIIGGGISGLSTAYAIQEKAKEASKEIKICLIEGEDHLGGKIQSDKSDGFLCEVGPNGFLDNKPETLKLCSDLKLEDKLLRSSDAARKRFIYSGGKLHQLPEAPGAFLTSDLLSLRGRLRVILELFTKIGGGEDETIAEFAERHLGREAVDKLIGPMVSGIYAGDPDKLSLKSCFPVMVDLEKEGDGSLIKAMIRRVKKKKKEGAKAKMAAGPSGVLTSFNEGMHVLVDALADAFEGKVLLGRKVLRIEEKKAFTIYLDDGSSIQGDIVVIATPAYVTEKMVKGLDPVIAEKLHEIPYVPVAVVCFGYPRESISHPIDGFGFLIPKNEGRRIMGCLWTSSIFPYRAPKDHVLIRTMVGGAYHPEIAALDDEALIKTVREELREILGIDAEPSFIRIFKHERAIPQYTIGHSKRLDAIEKQLENHPGLFITGNALRGIGINDCTRNAVLTAERVIDAVKSN